MKDLLELKGEMSKSNKSKKKNKSRGQPGLLALKTSISGDDTGGKRGLKWLPEKVEQGPYESSSQFLNRLQRMSSKAKAEALVEDKFQVDFCPKMTPQILSTKDGQITQDKRDEEMNDVLGVRGVKKREKRRVREMKRRVKKRKTTKPETDFKSYKDDVRFGEVVLAPPKITVKNKSALLKRHNRHLLKNK